MEGIDDSSVSQTTTAFLSAALGNSGNNVCSRGTAPSSSFFVIQTGSQVLLFVFSLFFKLFKKRLFHCQDLMTKQAANGLNFLRERRAEYADVILLNIEGTDPEINNTFCWPFLSFSLFRFRSVFLLGETGETCWENAEMCVARQKVLVSSSGSPFFCFQNHQKKS